MMGHLWQSTWFAAVVWLITLALRSHGARLRYWLWTAASVKFLVPFSWLVRLGAQFEWRMAPATAQPAAAIVMREVFAPSVLVAAPEALTQQSSAVPWLLAGIWLLGSAAALFWWWRQWLPVRAALREATPITLGNCDAADLAVMASPSMLEPAVVGIRRPLLLVPTGLVERLTPAQMNALMAHERCHIRCHDNLVAAMHMAVEAIFWFHPLVWWIAARQLDERERACDEAVLRAGSLPADYAEGILTVCRWSLGSPVACVSGITGSDLRMRIETIMAKRVGRRLNRAGRMLLAMGALMVLASPIGLGLLDAAAQSSNAPRPHFDVVSIKRTPEVTGSGADFAAMPGGRLHVRNNEVMNLIQNAYQLPSYRIVGAPDWVTSDRYDMEAKTEGTASRAQMMLMLQTLLEDRFKLRTHRETRESPVYILRVAKGGPKLSEFKEDSCVVRSPGVELPASERRPNCGNNLLRQRGTNLSWVATRINMAGVAGSLGIVVRRTVIDETGITGFFDVNVELPPLQPETGVSDPSALDSGASVFTVLRERLGLTLESGKRPAEHLVIDSVARPSEN